MRPTRRIGLPHVPDEIADFVGDRRTSWLTIVTELSPIIAKTLVLPSDDSAGLHERQRLLPGRPQARQQDPEESIP